MTDIPDEAVNRVLSYIGPIANANTPNKNLVAMKRRKYEHALQQASVVYDEVAQGNGPPEINDFIDALQYYVRGENTASFYYYDKAIQRGPGTDKLMVREILNMIRNLVKREYAKSDEQWATMLHNWHVHVREINNARSESWYKRVRREPSTIMLMPTLQY